jgi:archaellum component FlaC
MVLQFLPFLKAIIPHLAKVATVAIPVFSSKPGEKAKNYHIIAKQIEELQAASTQNAESIRVLAEKLRQTIQDIEDAAQDVRNKITRYKIMLFIALGLSVVSMLLSIILLSR